MESSDKSVPVESRGTFSVLLKVVALSLVCREFVAQLRGLRFQHTDFTANIMLTFGLVWKSFVCDFDGQIGGMTLY